MKIDLHCHTKYSYDSTIAFEDLKIAHQKRFFDLVAITDHGTTEGAELVKKAAAFPTIIGEEIKTKGGDVIGLFLKKDIPENLSLEQTIKEIKKQEGLVYVPHPFTWLRFGLGRRNLSRVLDEVDILETHNASCLSVTFDSQKKALRFAQQHNLVMGAGSDAHYPAELGTGYLEVKEANLERISTDPQYFLSKIKNGQPVMKYFFPVTKCLVHRFYSFIFKRC